LADPATGWLEIKEFKNKESNFIANIVEQIWLTRYPPWPLELTYDRGTEFMGELAQMGEQKYGIIKEGTTVRNPQANSVLEINHQAVGNICQIRCFTLVRPCLVCY